MCGLTGAFGRDIEPATVRALLLANQDRGTHSTGLMKADGAFFKDTDRALLFLKKAEAQKMILDGARAKAICGHTRNSTRGGHVIKNAHPFRYGMVTGMHNGIIDAPWKYDVDSEFAFDLLSQADPGDYQGALRDVAGWYVLVWHDARNGMIYLLNWRGDLHVVSGGGTIYYSSDGGHLKAATGLSDVREIKHQQVWCWNGKRLRQLKDFTGKEREVVKPSKRGWQRGMDIDSHYSQYISCYSPYYSGHVQKQEDGRWWAECYRDPVCGEKGRQIVWRLLPDQADMDTRFPYSQPGTSRWVGSGIVSDNFRRAVVSQPTSTVKDTELEPSEIGDTLSPSQLQAEIQKMEAEEMERQRAARRAVLEGQFGADEASRIIQEEMLFQ